MPRLAIALLLALTSAPLLAQAPNFVISDPPPTFTNNYPAQKRVIPVDDANGDGIDDFAVVGSNNTWQVRSGTNGVVLGTVGTPIIAPGPVREAICLGDVSGDGLGDLAVIEGLTMRLYPTGQSIPIWSVTLTQFVGTFSPAIPEPQLARLPDVDGDGIDDVAIGISATYLTIALSLAPGGGAPGAPIIPPGAPLPTDVEVRSGATGALITTVPSPLPAPDTRYVASAGDINGDGTPDLIVQSTLGTTTTVWIHDASNGAILTSYPLTPYAFPGELSGVADIDGDGLPDFCAADPTFNGQGAVHAYSAVNGAHIGSVLGEPGDSFGLKPHLGDHDGDGILDVAATAYGAGFTGGHVRVGSFATGRLLADTRVSGLPMQGGILTDTNGDGLDELLAGGTNVSGTYATGWAGRRGLSGEAAGNTAMPDVDADLLKISGSAGDGYRRVDLALDQPFSIDVDALPVAPGAAFSYAIFGFLGVPRAVDAFDLGPGTGAMAFLPAAAYAAGVPVLFTLATDVPGLPGTIVQTGPAPQTIGVPAGLPVAIDITLQALVFEPGSLLRKTNGILVSVR